MKGGTGNYDRGLMQSSVWTVNTLHSEALNFMFDP